MKSRRCNVLDKWDWGSSFGLQRTNSSHGQPWSASVFMGLKGNVELISFGSKEKIKTGFSLNSYRLYFLSLFPKQEKITLYEHQGATLLKINEEFFPFHPNLGCWGCSLLINWMNICCEPPCACLGDHLGGLLKQPQMLSHKFLPGQLPSSFFLLSSLVVKFHTVFFFAVNLSLFYFIISRLLICLLLCDWHWNSFLVSVPQLLTSILNSCCDL